TRTILRTICETAYFSDRSRPLFTRKRLKRNDFVRADIHKTPRRRATSRKIWTSVSEMPGNGLFQASGMPAALIAVTEKKISVVRLKIAGMIETKFLPSLSRVRKRRNRSL